MVAQIASFGSVNLAQGFTARAVTAVVVATAPTEHAQHHAAQMPASTVALAPAAMTALIEAQERLSQNASPLVRQQTAQKIDQLIWRLDGPDRASGVPLAVRQLQAARQALSLDRVDVQA